MADAALTPEFRQRGTEMTRLETFADAAFAFAVTLLVVGGGDAIPTSFDEMMQAMEQVPAFAASFANIMLFWYAHHRWSRRYGLSDARASVLTMLLIFVVLIYVYPLKAVYSGALHYLTGGYLDSYFALSSYDNLRSLFVIFGAGYAAMSMCIVLLNRHALRHAAALSLSAVEHHDTVSEIQHWLLNVAVPIVSIVLALVLPDDIVVVAGIFYSCFGIFLPWHAAMRSRSRKQVA